MHLSLKHINIILNILLGAAWAATIYLFFYGFITFNGNFFIKFLNAILHFVFGLILVLIVELIFNFFKLLDEQKKTNKLLKEILEKKCD
jgi:cell shape-determining protein MreC